MLACYYSGQVKVAEMPLDTCRMMQAIEWEDPGSQCKPIHLLCTFTVLRRFHIASLLLGMLLL